MRTFGTHAGVLFFVCCCFGGLEVGETKEFMGRTKVRNCLPCCKGQLMVNVKSRFCCEALGAEHGPLNAVMRKKGQTMSGPQIKPTWGMTASLSVFRNS